MRRLLLALLLLGAGGTLAELLLLGHTEGWQRLPLALLALGLLVSIVEASRPSRRTERLLRLVMVSFIVGGSIGLYQHYSGNREFELEMNPARGGFELMRESLTGATPALAPAAMVYLGLLGLLYGRAVGTGYQGGPAAGRGDGPPEGRY